MKHLNTRDTADLLGVSEATVRNWYRAGHIEASADRPLLFERTEVFALRERIRSNRFNRLRQRANKSASGRVIPPETTDQALLADLLRVGRAASAHGLDSDCVVYLAALRLLESRDEARLPAADRLGRDYGPADVAWRRKPVRDTMLAWAASLSGPPGAPPGGELDRLLERDPPDDPLGLLYQCLSPVGMKSRSGSYFTPGRIIDESVAALPSKPRLFLDPCCGTGRYLLRAAERFGLGPESLRGFDSDPAAVAIARLNLLLRFPRLDAVPQVECLDSLSDLANGEPGCATNPLLGHVDAIATNPPWGGSRNRQRAGRPASLVRSGESFSLFLEKSLALLRKGGHLSFLLPEAVLKIKTHIDVRRIILEQASIRNISLLGRVFPGVFTPIIRLDLEKKPAPSGWRVHIAVPGGAHRVPQGRFAVNPGLAFDVGVTSRDEEILGTIFAVEHEILQNRADWALGIVTGDNRGSLLDAPAAGAEPVLRGRDVFPYTPRTPRWYIRFAPAAFQQVAPEHLYRAPEKLVYRFVSSRLVFALDARGLLTLNSANILIPRLDGMTLRASLAFLNSRVFQYVFLKRFRTRKILRGDLERLPFPPLSRGMLARVEELVDSRLAGERRAGAELDRLIFQCFGLGEAGVAEIERSLRAELGGKECVEEPNWQ